MNRGAFRGWAAVAASIAVCLLAAVAAPVARAGTIWVTDGAGSCNAFSVYANPGAFIIPSSCPMTIDVRQCDPVRDERVLDDDRAPRDHDQPRVDRKRRRERRQLDHRHRRRRLLARRQHRRHTADPPSRRVSDWFNTALEGSSNINSQIYGIQIVCTQNNWTFGGCSWSNPPWFTVSGIELQGTENSAPYVTGQGRPVDERIVRVESARR